jgi:hypothetical protein
VLAQNKRMIKKQSDIYKYIWEKELFRICAVVLEAQETRAASEEVSRCQKKKVSVR